MAKVSKNEEMEEQVEQQPQEKKKGSLVKWAIIIVIALVFILGGGAGAVYYFNMMSSPKKAVIQAKPVIGTIWPMEPFIINLQDNNGERYLKLVIQLEIPDPSGVAELELLKPKLRDNVLDLLAAKTSTELMEVAGKQRLREEIAMRLNSIVTGAKISRVYFTEFVVQ